MWGGWRTSTWWFVCPVQYCKWFLTYHNKVRYKNRKDVHIEIKVCCMIYKFVHSVKFVIVMKFSQSKSWLFHLFYMSLSMLSMLFIRIWSNGVKEEKWQLLWKSFKHGVAFQACKVQLIIYMYLLLNLKVHMKKTNIIIKHVGIIKLFKQLLIITKESLLLLCLTFLEVWMIHKFFTTCLVKGTI